MIPGFSSSGFGKFAPRLLIVSFFLFKNSVVAMTLMVP